MSYRYSWEDKLWKTVITPSYDIKPTKPGFKIWSSQPTRSILKADGQEFTLVKEEYYEVYRLLDLHYDFKSIKQAEEYLKSIPGKMHGLMHAKDEITSLLKELPKP